MFTALTAITVLILVLFLTGKFDKCKNTKKKKRSNTVKIRMQMKKSLRIEKKGITSEPTGNNNYNINFQKNKL